MFFIMKKSTVVVDAFTTNPAAHKFFPIDSANNFLPEWWKRTEKYTKPIKMGDGGVLVQGNTIRRCAGVIDYYNSNNLVIPLWTDIEIDIGPQEYRTAPADGCTKVGYHSQDMRGEFMPEYEHLKIASAWKFKEKDGIKFHFSQLFYNFDDPCKLVMPPAIVNYKYQHSTEINFMVRRPVTNQRVSLEAGQPMVLLTPLTERKVVVKCHLLTEDEFDKQFKWVFAFNNVYNKAKKIKQQQESKKSKCPFHFGK